MATPATFILVDPLTGQVRPELGWLLDRLGMDGALGVLERVTRAMRYHQPCPVCWQGPVFQNRFRWLLRWPCKHVKMTTGRLALVLTPAVEARLSRQAKRPPPPTSLAGQSPWVSAVAARRKSKRRRTP